jgi:hypothetical protein
VNPAHGARRLLRLLPAGFVALAAALGASSAHAAAEIHVVDAEFIPAAITLEATSTLRVALRNNGAGGQRASIDYSLAVPTGLAVHSHQLGQDCDAAAVEFFTEPSQSGVTLFGLTLLPSGTCTVDLSVSAAATGQYTFEEQGNGSTILSTTLTVTAPAVAEAAAIAVSPTSVPFPPQEVGVASAARLVTVSNPAGVTLALTGISASGPFAATSECDTVTLAPGEACAFAVTFTPTATGPAEGSIEIVSNAPQRSIDLSGEGIAPLPLLSPAGPLLFGDVAVNSSATTDVTLTNSVEATAALAISGISASGAFGTSHDCPASLGVGDSCTITVSFAPATAGEHGGMLTVSTSASTFQLALSGSAIALPVLAVSPASLAFGSQTVDVASATQPVTVTNAGAANLEVTAIVASGDFNFTGCPTPVTLSPGMSCTLAIKFLPTALGLRSGWIDISSNAPEVPQDILLTGTGTLAPVPAIAATPSSANLGAILVGATSTARFVLSSTGQADLSIAGISVTGPHFGQSNTCPPVLAVGATCEIEATYAPTAAGSHAGELRIASNAAPGLLVMPLSGSALAETAPALVLSGDRLAFGQSFVNVVSSPRTITVTNAGTGPMHIASIASEGDFGYSGCGFPSTLLPGASCALSITFRPLSEGPAVGRMQVFSDAPGSPHSIELSGTGILILNPQIDLTPSAHDFGNLRVGEDDAVAMRLTSVGNMALTISAISTAGASFTQANSCPALLAPGAFCDIEVTYAPSATGAHSGQLRIDSNATPARHVAALSGTATPVPPAFMVVDRVLDFGQQLTKAVARAPLEIRNSGGLPLVITGMRFFGASVFGIEGDCGAIAPMGRCSLTVLFAPTAAGAFAGRMEIASNHSRGVVVVELAGQGIKGPYPDLELSVEGLGFGNQMIGSIGDERSVGLANAGTVPLQFQGFDASVDFLVDSSRCPAQLQPDQSCEVRVTFKPVAPGPRGGALTITSNAIGAPHSVSLTGTGCRFFTMRAARSGQRLCAP